MPTAIFEPNKYSDRKCEVCKCRMQAYKLRDWRLNGIVPAGKAISYRCVACQHEVDIRTSWHIALLAFAVIAVVSDVDKIQARSIVSQVLILGVTVYIMYALISDTFNRFKNPVWSIKGADA